MWRNYDKKTKFGKPLCRSIMAVVMMMLSLQAMAYDFSYTHQGKTLFYGITSDSTIKITYYSSVADSNNYVSGDVVIPSSVEYNGTTYSVTSIGNSAFRNCTGLTSVTIPTGVTSIGWGVFNGCTGLTSVTIPTGVTSIEGYTFYDCSSLTSVTIPNSVTSIGNSAFRNCTGLTSITIPTGVTSIEGYTFNGCTGLTSVTIGNSVTSIGNMAFYGCSGLTSVTIPNSVTSIGESAFNSCMGLTSVTIGNSVTSIGDYAFRNCTGLTSVTIGNSVTSIGDYAFRNCTGLTSLTIPNSVTSIGNRAFSDCSGLTSVTIGNSVTSIGNMAFYGCSGLTSVTIPNSVTSIGESAFSDCNGLTSVTIGNSVSSIGIEAFYWCRNLTSVTIGSGVTSIDMRAFSECTALTSVRCLAVTPPSIDNTSFSNVPSTCTLAVPCGSIGAYTGSDWNEYFAGRISEEFVFEFNVSANDATFGSVAVSTGESCNEKTLTATANEGYEFTGWNDGNTENPRTVTVTSDTAFTAIFAETETTPTITVTVNDATMGSATYTLDGNTAVLTATANEGYEFTGWNDGNTENPRTVTITSDTAFMAIFAEAVSTPTITLTVNDATMGSATYTMDGNTAVLTATPNDGYEFTGWNDGNTENPRTVTVTSDTAFMAIFTASGSSSLQAVSAREFAMYPNPAKSFVTLEFEALHENALLQIFDINGRRVRTLDLKAGVETLRIDVSDLPKGVYTITIGNTTKKLIVE